VPPIVSGELSASSILSGQTVHFRGTFSDAGVLDMPWTWAIGWGDATTPGTAIDQSLAIEADHRFCAAKSYSVSFSVTDKDGGVGSTRQALRVSRNTVPIVVHRPVNVHGVGNGLLTVHVLSTPLFDARDVDPATAMLSDGQAGEMPAAVENDGAPFASVQDTNGDGLPDLVLRFRHSGRVTAANLSAATASLTLLATMNDGCIQVQGSTSLRVVP
jgi:hypothetical protein